MKGIRNDSAQTADIFPKLRCQKVGAIKGIIAIESRIPINGNMLKKGSSSPNESVEAKRLLKSMIPNNEIFLIIKSDIISFEDLDAFKAYQ